MNVARVMGWLASEGGMLLMYSELIEDDRLQSQVKNRENISWEYIVARSRTDGKKITGSHHIKCVSGD